MTPTWVYFNLCQVIQSQFKISLLFNRRNILLKRWKCGMNENVPYRIIHTLGSSLVDMFGRGY